MVEIEFSVMEGAPGDANHLRPLLDAFEKQYSIHVNLIGIPWNKGWGEIAKLGIYGHGPDVSAIGTSWIGSLASMQALRPFTPQQVKAVGGAETFFEANWRAGFLPNDPTPWAIPWLGDALVLYYWKETLEKAGVVDIAAAFSSDTALVKNLEALQKSGIAYPLALNITKQDIVLHEAAHWVWTAGGDFISPDFRTIAFDQPAAMQGWKNYFSLRPFISPKWLDKATASGDSFVAQASAIQMGGPYMATAEIFRHPETRSQRMGIAQAPGAAYVGGASFVIWQYSIRNQEAFELVRFLASQPTSIPASPHSLELPTRRDAVHIPSVENDDFHRTFLQAMQAGRSFPTMRLWGAVEDKLITEIANIWADLFANPDQDLDACLDKHFGPLAQRLNMVLGS
jgi:multiple sugar transport system substrate-binding protein